MKRTKIGKRTMKERNYYGFQLIVQEDRVNLNVVINGMTGLIEWERAVGG